MRGGRTWRFDCKKNAKVTCEPLSPLFSGRCASKRETVSERCDRKECLAVNGHHK